MKKISINFLAFLIRDGHLEESVAQIFNYLGPSICLIKSYHLNNYF